MSVYVCYKNRQLKSYFSSTRTYKLNHYFQIKIINNIYFFNYFQNSIFLFKNILFIFKILSLYYRHLTT